MGRDGAGTDVGMGELDDDQALEPRDIELFTGGAVLLRAEFLRQVGVFDERYFMYYEDVDLCRRLRRSGFDVKLVPAAKAVHDAHRQSHRNARHLLWHLASMLRFLSTR